MAKRDDQAPKDLYDLLRLDFGNEPVKPETLPEAEKPKRRYVRGSKAKFPPRTRVEPSPVDARKADPEAWKVAKRATKGDVSRLEILEDGSVLIHNNPIR